jgi:hypothetical protein
VSSLDALTEPQRKALYFYRQKHIDRTGNARGWKQKLGGEWVTLRYSYVHDCDFNHRISLTEIRNSKGPNWLMSLNEKDFI